ATSEFRKKESAEVLRNPFPRKLFPQNFVRIVSDFLVGIAFKKGSNFVQNIPHRNFLKNKVVGNLVFWYNHHITFNLI
ncbi:MAG TPA: hypothetical protein VJH75_03860, partial [Patescibacteria group bacterium]|nr:hypothetical protein [Patescibacteria group bacterium]